MNATTATTKRQVLAALKSAGISDKVATVTGSGRSWEIETVNESGKRSVCKAIRGLGGFRCGHGGWVLRASYQGSGDYSDPSSRWHY